MLPELGPITSTGLGQISAVAVQGATAAAGQLDGGQVALVDLATATVRATVSTSLAGVGSVAFCAPALVLAAGPNDACAAVIDFSASPPSVSYLFPGLGSGLTVAGDSGLAAVGASALGSAVTLFDPVSGWQQGWGAVPGGASSIGLSGTSAVYGTATAADAFLADIPTGNLAGPAVGITVTSTSFSAGVGSGVAVSRDGTDGVCGGASSSAVALFDLAVSPPALLSSMASGLPSIGSIGTGSFSSPGGPAAATWTPAALAFGTVVTGTTGTLTLSITNSGGGALKAGIASGSAAFTVSTADLWVPAGQTCAIEVSFDPASPASHASTLSMQTSDPGHPAVSIPMSGSAGQPAGQAAWTTSLDFSPVPVGMTRTKDVSISNAGPGDLGITGITSSVACWTADLRSLTVHPGQPGTVRVSFHPGAATAYAGELTFQTSDSSRPAGSTSLSGSGQEPAGRATWAPGAIDFGNVAFGATRSGGWLAIANTGSGDLGITNLSWPANCTPDAASTGPLTVATGQTIELGATFAAPGAGAYSWSGTLSFDTTDPAWPAVGIPMLAELSNPGCLPSTLVKARQAVTVVAGRIRQSRR